MIAVSRVEVKGIVRSRGKPRRKRAETFVRPFGRLKSTFAFIFIGTDGQCGSESTVIALLKGDDVLRCS